MDLKCIIRLCVLILFNLLVNRSEWTSRIRLKEFQPWNFKFFSKRNRCIIKLQSKNLNWKYKVNRIRERKSLKSFLYNHFIKPLRILLFQNNLQNFCWVFNTLKCFTQTILDNKSTIVTSKVLLFILRIFA